MSNQKNIAIIQFPGSNTERETVMACRRVGLNPVEFLWNELDIVHTYKPVCDSFRYHGLMGEKYAITLFNQSNDT